MNETFCSFMNVSQCNALVCVMNVFVLFVFALEEIHIISAFHIFRLIFELEAIPFWYRLLEPTTKRISYQVLIKCQDSILLSIFCQSLLIGCTRTFHTKG